MSNKRDAEPQILSHNKRGCCRLASPNTKGRVRRRFAAFLHTQSTDAASARVLHASPALMLKVLRRANKAPAVAKPAEKSLVCRGLSCCFPLSSSTAGFKKQILERAVAAGFILDLPSYISTQSRREEIHSQTGTGCQSLRQQKPLYTHGERGKASSSSEAPVNFSSVVPAPPPLPA